VPRSPEQIQQDIDAARESLAATLDELAFRTSPKRLTDQGKAKAQAFLQSPPGMAIVGGVGLLVTFVVTRGIVRRIKR
jgi:proteasome assembly chaperone (PAC2) family protein